MGDATVIGYQKGGQDTKEFIPISLKNPCRIDSITAPDQNKYEVIYYFVRIKYQDGAITDDELMPFVFKDDRLIGKGWGFLNHLKGQPTIKSPAS